MPDGQRNAPRSAREVLAYFLHNERAAADLEGVARWRVQQEVIPHTVEQVGRALSWLVEQGFLVRDAAPGVVPTFRLNRSRAAEARRFLDATASLEARDIGGDSEPAAIVPTTLLTASLAWVKEALFRYHKRNPPSRGDVPGLTRSFASVESSLAPPVVTPDSAPADVSDADRLARDLLEAFEAAGDAEPLAALYRHLKLEPIELQLFLLCLAPELDARYQGLCGVLNDDLGRRTMTLGLACAVLGDPIAVRTELARYGGLTRWRLLEHGATFPFGDEPLRVDPAIAAWILGERSALLEDRLLVQSLRRTEWPGGGWVRQPSDVALIARLSEDLSTAPSGGWIVLSGPDLDGSRAVVEAAARKGSRSLLRISLPSMTASGPVDSSDAAARLARAAQIMRAVAVLDVGMPKADTDVSGAIARMAAALDGTDTPRLLLLHDVQAVVTALPDRDVRLLQRGTPDHASIASALSAAASEANLDLRPRDAEELAATYPLPLGALHDALRLAVLSAAPSDTPENRRQALAASLRRAASPDLPRFARRVESTFRLSDVVLPPDRHAQLDEIVAHVRFASHVLNTWGFGAQLPYGRGVTALFSGPSGTGKTMAALALAHELQTDTYVVDLSLLVSKYIGDTEKHLDAVFNDAERAGAVLLFDEADALFGKRSEVKDAHDRYANIEVAYLLQRMETFTGLAILTTNFRRNLDDAFLRRLRLVLDFPRPDPAAREAIWRRCLPSAAPVGHDVNLRLLARRLDLTGGNIRQITVRAAFAAARENAGAISMRHVLSATRAELLKIGMQGAERELAALEAAERQRNATRVA